MKFSPIHPSVLDVYFNTLRINELGAILDGYSAQSIPEDLRLEIDDAAHVFARAEKTAINILGSRERLNEQLLKLHASKGFS